VNKVEAAFNTNHHQGELPCSMSSGFFRTEAATHWSADVQVPAATTAPKAKGITAETLLTGKHAVESKRGLNNHPIQTASMRPGGFRRV
jgi:hypothetical protein